MKSSTINPQTFDEFYILAPQEIQDYFDALAHTPQSPIWHPEGDALTHTRIVFNRAQRTGDINLMLAALFHDLGKAKTTRPHKTITDSWSSPGHELVSTRLVEKWRDWIEFFGADYEIVHYIVKQHMRVQQLDKMRPKKREAFIKDKYFEYVRQFSEFDDMTKDFSNDINR